MHGVPAEIGEREKKENRGEKKGESNFLSERRRSFQKTTIFAARETSPRALIRRRF